jgi:hypothetical protein
LALDTLLLLGFLEVLVDLDYQSLLLLLEVLRVLEHLLLLEIL